MKSSNRQNLMRLALFDRCLSNHGFNSGFYYVVHIVQGILMHETGHFLILVYLSTDFDFMINDEF